MSTFTTDLYTSTIPAANIVSNGPNSHATAFFMNIELTALVNGKSVVFSPIKGIGVKQSFAEAYPKLFNVIEDASNGDTEALAKLQSLNVVGTAYAGKTYSEMMLLQQLEDIKDPFMKQLVQGATITSNQQSWVELLGLSTRVLSADGSLTIDPKVLYSAANQLMPASYLVGNESAKGRRDTPANRQKELRLLLSLLPDLNQSNAESLSVELTGRIVSVHSTKPVVTTADGDAFFD